MTIAETALPFGMREVVLTPIDDAGDEGDPVALPHSRTFSFSEAEDFEELRGGDQLVAVRGQGAEVEWALEAGGISLEAWAVLSGGEITEDGTTPDVTRRYRKRVSDQRPYFKAEGRAISDSGGDFHTVVYKCRASENIEGTMEDGAFWLTSASGRGLPVDLGTDPEDLGVLYDFLHNETAEEIGTD